MDESELKKQAKRFNKLVGKIEDEFNKDKTPAEKRICPRHRDTKMPTGFLPTNTTTRQMLLVAHVAIERLSPTAMSPITAEKAPRPSSLDAGGSSFL